MSCLLFFLLSSSIKMLGGHTHGLSIRRTMSKSEENPSYPVSDLAWVQGS